MATCGAVDWVADLHGHERTAGIEPLKAPVEVDRIGAPHGAELVGLARRRRDDGAVSPPHPQQLSSGRRRCKDSSDAEYGGRPGGNRPRLARARPGHLAFPKACATQGAEEGPQRAAYRGVPPEPLSPADCHRVIADICDALEDLAGERLFPVGHEQVRVSVAVLLLHASHEALDNRVHHRHGHHLRAFVTVETSDPEDDVQCALRLRYRISAAAGLHAVVDEAQAARQDEGFPSSSYRIVSRVRVGIHAPRRDA
mmetsp:Transcript_10716/g.24632  ORF Transcript_10716/g.24632 Transcript_10716/m.24632 type:complete len:255 (+) Transcript_10716:1071-1835(+)